MRIDNIEWFVDALEMGVYKLPELHGRYKKLKNELEDINNQKSESKKELQDLHNYIIDLKEVEKTYLATNDKMGDELSNLMNEKDRLKAFITNFKNSNKKYLKVKAD